jgi:chromosome segregation ATPase
VVTRLAAAVAVASEVTTRPSLEAAKQSVEDRSTTTQAAAATTTTEWHALATRMAQVEEEIERLPADMATANDTAEKATTAATTAEATGRDAVQTAAREMTTLKTKVAELE